MKSKVFITGSAGCVGHYLIDLLSKDDDLELYLLIRNTSKVKYDLSKFNVIEDDFFNIQNHTALLKEMDYVIHLLPDWGGETGNYDKTLILFNSLDLSKCKKVIYFSTASILGNDSSPTPEVLECGTGYIRSKYKMYAALKNMPVSDRTIILFPTWVLGGDKDHPYSHAYFAVKQLKNWLWLLRYFTCDLKFHFMHSYDIAAIAAHLLKSDIKAGEYVVGNKVLTVGDFINELLNHFGVRTWFRFNISKRFVNMIAGIFGKKLADWDKYCIKTYHQEFKTANPSDFGMTTKFPSAASIINDVFEGRR